MNRTELVKLKHRVFNEMLTVMNLCAKDNLSIGDGLESLAALRHLYEVASRELDDADLQVGVDSYALDIYRELDWLATEGAYVETVKDSAKIALQLMEKLHPRGGAK